ncbi:MAG TPA: glycine oxidase ThiO [Candidatus Sulfotelmatobacter sp.]|nr:glycine oxidase ThiO [Candidatus Sulfotelmatobacter sp.]
MKTYDAVIVGGGIIGGSIAFDLGRRALRVAVLDRQELMREASWAAAGMLSPAPDCPAAISLVPVARASLALYPEFVDRVEDASGLRVGYREGGTVEIICHGDAERELSTLVALHHGLGLACEPLPLDEALELEPGLGHDARAAAFLPDECSIEPRALSAAVLAAAKSAGAELRPGVEVTSLILQGNRCVGVKTSEGETIHAAQVVLAAGCWSSQILGASPYAPTLPVRGQMAALRHSGMPLRHVLRSERGYLVPRGEETPQTIVVGSTIENAGYEKRITAGGIEKILSAANELVPGLEKAEIVETWCGLRPGTPDQLPILGPADIEGLVFATGHYRNGILLAAVTAKLVGEWIADRRVSLGWEKFSPLRFAPAEPNRSASASSPL